MSYKVRKLNLIEDFDIIEEWWSVVGEPSPGLREMPEDSSYVVEIANKAAAAIALYFTNGAFCFIGNLIIDPDLKDSEVRQRLMSTLHEHVLAEAGTRGFKYFLATTWHGKLADRFKSLGFMGGPAFYLIQEIK